MFFKYQNTNVAPASRCLNSRRVWSTLTILILSFLMGACGPLRGQLKTNLKGGALVFPSTKLFEAQKASVFLFNVKGSAVTITDLKLVGEAAVNFELLQGLSTPHVLEAGVREDGKQKGQWLILQFFASKPGTYQASLEISYQLEQGGPNNKMLLPLKADAKVVNNDDARIKIEPAAGSLDFGSITTRGAQTLELVLYNESNTAITINSVDIVNNDSKTFKQAFPLPQPFQVFPGKANGRTLLLQASNTKEGTYEAWLRVASSNAINLSKDGIRLVKLKVKITKYLSPGNLRFHVSSGRVYFKEVPPNEERRQEITLYNSGQLPAKITSMQIINDPNKVWSLRDEPKVPFTIEGPGLGSGKSMQVVFKDPKPNYRLSRLQVTYIANPKYPESKRTIVLTLLHEKARPLLSVGCRTLEYGTVKKGDWELRLCSIRSFGNVDLVIKSLTWETIKGKASNFKMVQPILPFGLRPGTSHSLQIKYTPTSSKDDDEIRVILETNLVLDKPEDKPRILLRGRGKE